VDFVFMTLLVSAIIGCATGLAILLNLDLHKVSGYLGTSFFIMLLVLVVVEYRRRSKRFPKK